MQVLIIHVFGHHHHLRNWMARVNVSDDVVMRRASDDLLITSDDQVRVKCVVVSTPADMERLRGLRPSMIVEEDSFRPIEGWYEFKVGYLRQVA